eukprot:gb/GECG01007398.1/.p1 GENE.gb/GECG01007398.1/~~gb/GECG01007398.1/.p1  ORF type:complete len:127 (+),score=13.79 gb/GECG01007398.1/:1-381(+)
MCSRGVWQLEHLLVRYCKHSGSSQGIRQYIGNGLVEFARENPQVKIETENASNKHPLVKGQYVNGRTKAIEVKNKNSKDIARQVQYLRDSSGRKLRHVTYRVSSKHPSIQGVWDTSTTFDNFQLRS